MEADYSADVLAIFEKFKQGAVKHYPVDFPGGPDMNHVEAHVLDLVARLYPDIFSGPRRLLCPPPRLRRPDARSAGGCVGWPRRVQRENSVNRVKWP